MSRIAFKNISKVYSNGVVAVGGVDLEIESGEFVVFIGPSGSGKSSLLRLVAGLEEISAGELWLDGVCINQVRPRDRDIAMVFQDYALYPHMSVRQNLGFSLKLRGYSRQEIDRRVVEVAEVLGLEALLDRRPGQLSGGQRQRVAMGRAMVRKPKVFLFDEPLSNLDAKLRVQMRVELAKLHQRLRTTTLYVTHDQTEAMTLATRIVVLDGGRVQQVGSPLELYRCPANVFVATFLGSPEMNLLEVEVEVVGEEVRFRHPLLSDAICPPLSFSREWRGILQNHRRVILGVRPEDLRVSEVEGILVRLEVVERMGGESYFYFSFGDRMWVVKVSSFPTVGCGDEIRIWIPFERVHFFAVEDRSRIFPGVA
ncbi:MAG: sn-glycerol-3-phosphate ABC transporter ATP-binding protein UgpC [Planctomycetota bacterium]|nr:MAG: sn-glycerol-3-phosphate ABC transporter ATP-binding protein UgpC [Planctomycetota bacterium]